DVAIVETGSEERVVDTIVVSHENLDMIPSGSKDNPVLRIDIKVEGNTGDVILNSLAVKSLNTSDTDISAGGVKLYYNFNKKDFYAADPYDTVTFSAGEAVFQGLNLELPTGYTYLWITCDVSADAIHGHYADAMIQAQGIDIGGTGYPDTDLSPAGSKIIYEAVYYDDFTTDKGWMLGGDFERGRPQGLGGTYIGNPDPEHAAGDTMILGNDLSGLGIIPGDYEPNVARYINLATSPSMDLAYYKDVKLNFLRWLNIENSDTASIEMSLDGGSSWKQVWANNNNLVSESKWSLFSLDLPGAHRQDTVSFRINLGPTNTNNHFSGWNIDNFSVTGNYIADDVAVVAFISPLSGCGHTAADIVTVKVRNYGPAATPGTIPLRYSFNGGASFTCDTIKEAIPFNEEIIYTFIPAIDLSVPGIYNVLVESVLETDE
ncbi:MAG: hypothetical protein A2Y87_04155, partial [Bacteroidetes bacterium RBG_13_46_8]